MKTPEGDGLRVGEGPYRSAELHSPQRERSTTRVAAIVCGAAIACAAAAGAWRFAQARRLRPKRAAAVAHLVELAHAGEA